MKWSKIKIELTIRLKIGLKVELKIYGCVVCDLEERCYASDDIR
jgi:hypothetical protein